VLTLRCASSTPDREPLAPPAGVARHSLLPAELLPAELVDSDQILVDRVQARKQRRMIQTSMYTGGVGMAVAASLATLDLQIVCATMLTLAAALTSYKHTVWDGHNRDSGLCVPMHQTSFEIFKVAGKGNGLFSSCHISKGQFLMRYEGERIDDLEFERRYASDPFSDEAGYVMRVTDDEFIDGSNPEISGFARYMNHAQTPNVDKYIAQRPGGTCSFFAARDISAGEELVISYGDEYWVAKGTSPVAWGFIYGYVERARVRARERGSERERERERERQRERAKLRGRARAGKKSSSLWRRVDIYS